MRSFWPDLAWPLSVFTYTDHCWPQSWSVNTWYTRAYLCQNIEQISTPTVITHIGRLLWLCTGFDLIIIMYVYRVIHKYTPTYFCVPMPNNYLMGILISKFSVIEVSETSHYQKKICFAYLSNFFKVEFFPRALNCFHSFKAPVNLSFLKERYLLCRHYFSITKPNSVGIIGNYIKFWSSIS